MRIQDIKRATNDRGGLTIRLADGTEPTEGYAIAVGSTVNDHVWQTADLALGTWHDGGKVYLEWTVIEQDREQAEFIARLTGQKAIYDLAAKQTIPV